MRQSDIIDEVRTIILDASIDASPENYEICHRIVTRSDPDMNRHVEVIRGVGGSIDAGAFQKIRDTAKPPRGQINAERHMAAIDAQLAKIMAASADAQADSSAYTGTLSEAASQLKALHAGESGELIIARLITQTMAMEKRAQALEASLASSSTELDSLRAELERARRESGSDALTSLPNRRAFDSRLIDAIAVAQATREPLSLAFFDIDHFKRFNDTWGHKLGDQVLRFVGSQLARTIGDVGLPARFGGEEFVALLPNHGSADALGVVRRFCEAVSARLIRTRTDNKEVGHITLSAGVVTLRRGETADSLVERADQAMYKAKLDGRDRIVSAV